MAKTSIISLYRHDISDEADLEIYRTTVRLRDEGAPRREVERRIVRCFAPPYHPYLVKQIVKEAY